MIRLALLSASLLLPAQAVAQSGHQGHAMPAEQPKAEKPKPTEADPHAGHDMESMAEEPKAAEQADPHAGHDMSGTEEKADADAAEQPAADPHAGHDMGAMAAEDSGESEVGDAPAPAPPTDHAADTVFGGDVMAQSRKELAHEVGGMGYSLVMLDLAEIGFQKGRESFRFEGEAFTGGNINRFGVKFEGEGAFGEPIEDLELQALYSRAIAPYWNLQAGIRYDIKPDPSRTYAVLGVEGMAPYWFKLTGAAFLSNKGEVRARLEGSYDLRLTQELILQPRIETNLSFQDIPAIGIGSGFTDFEAGLRLRYEIKQEVAPYIGVEWRKQFGDTARFTRAAGEDPSSVNFVAGIRIWF
jgi:copper resistance protein B